MPSKLEKIDEDAAVLYAEGLNYIHLKQNGLGFRGKPDNWFLAPAGAQFFIEFKRLGEPLRPLQWYWAKQFAMRRCVVYRCDNIEHAKRILQNHLDPSALPIEGAVAYDEARQCWTLSRPRDGEDEYLPERLPDPPQQGPSAEGTGDSPA